MSEQSKVFFTKVLEKIKRGYYDQYISLFVSRELIYSSIKARVNKKIETGATPLLNEAELKDAIKDAKETGDLIISIFLDKGILASSTEGIILSEKGNKLLKMI
jgi:hypothetical protein